MDVAYIQTVTAYVLYYTPYVILVLGNIGCLCGCLTFTSKQLRQNSCGWYFLMSTLFDFLYINIGLFTKLATSQYGSTLINTNLAWCRIRSYLTWILPSISTGFLILTSIDRCLSTSTSTRLRSFSQIKVAYRMTCVPIIIYSLTTSHQLFYYDLLPTCTSSPGTYSYFLSMYSIIWTSLIPQGAMLIFGLMTYYNVRKSHQRLLHRSGQQINQSQRTHNDSQLIRMTLVQVLCNSILLNLRTGYYAYVKFSTNIPKSPYRIALEYLLVQLSDFIFYLNFSTGFYLNTLSSKLFRKVFIERVALCYRRLTWWKDRIRVQPLVITRTIPTKLQTVPVQETIAIQKITLK